MPNLISLCKTACIKSWSAFFSCEISTRPVLTQNRIAEAQTTADSIQRSLLRHHGGSSFNLTWLPCGSWSNWSAFSRYGGEGQTPPRWPAPFLRSLLPEHRWDRPAPPHQSSHGPETNNHMQSNEHIDASHLVFSFCLFCYVIFVWSKPGVGDL